MRKKPCCLILALLFAIFAFAAPLLGSATKSGFADIGSHWAKEDIVWAHEEGLISGTTHTTFAPNKQLTRGMYITVLYRLAGCPAVEEVKESFADVSEKDYFYKAVHWGVSNNIIFSKRANRFDPNGEISRLDIAESLHRYHFYDYRIKNPGGPFFSLEYPEYPSQYTDTTDIAYSQAMKWAVGLSKIITGRTTTTLAPHEGCTRAEIVVMLRRFVRE